MNSKQHLLPLAIAYLRANPSLQMTGGKRLAADVTEPKCSNNTWDKARKALNLPHIPRAGMTYRRHHSSREERKAAFAVYPNTHKIVVDLLHFKVIFHGTNGYKITEKKTWRDLSASLRLFRLAKFETRSHDLETGIMVLTLKAEALEGRQAA